MSRTVTIAIPTYNRADSTLPIAVSSAQAQKYDGLEILISDNCSDDETASYVTGLNDSRITYIRHEKNIGARKNFISCADSASGEYFLLLHDDDAIDSDMVETCMRELPIDQSPGVIRCGTRVINATGQTLSELENNTAGLSFEELFLQWFSGKTAFYLCSTLYHVEFLRQAGGLDSQHGLYQDVIALAKLAARHGRHDVPDVKASFRRHDDNRGTAAEIHRWCDDSLQLIETVCDEVSGQTDQLRTAGKRWLCKANYRYTFEKPMSLPEKWRTMHYVYRAFDRCYSPLTFLSERYLHPRYFRARRALVSQFYNLRK